MTEQLSLLLPQIRESSVCLLTRTSAFVCLQTNTNTSTLLCVSSQLTADPGTCRPPWYMSQNLKKSTISLCTYNTHVYTIDISYIHTHFFFFFSWRTLIQLGSRAQSPNSSEYELDISARLSWPSNQIRSKSGRNDDSPSCSLCFNPSSRTVFQRLSRPRLYKEWTWPSVLPFAPHWSDGSVWSSEEQGQGQHSGIQHRTSKEILAVWQCVVNVLFFCVSLNLSEDLQSNETNNA